MENYEDGSLELYNLKNDLGEKHNLAQTDPDRAQELKAKLDAWRESVGAQMPTPNAKRDDSDRPREKGKKGRGKRNRTKRAT